MKKTLKRFLAGVLAVASLSTVCLATACGSGGGNAEGTLRVEAVQLGYGLEWLEQMGKEWSTATGYKFRLNTSIGSKGNESIETKVKEHADTDLFVYRTADYATRIYEGEISVKGQKYPNVFLDITDVCNKKLDGEGGATIDSKLNEEFKNLYKVNDKYYGLPWIEGTTGILRNVTLWNKLGLTDDDVPLTTDQLFATCEKIKGIAERNQTYSNIAPFIYCAEDEYYSMFMGVWFMQYESDENIANYFAGKDMNGQYSQSLFNYQGHLEMLSVLEKLLKKTNKYQLENSENLNFTDMQGYFLRERAVFCVNGAWIENEMGSVGGNVRIDYIKTPVISALANKLSFKNDADKDDKLAELVKYADDTATGYEGKPSFATNDDVDTVRKARKRSYVGQGSSHVLAGASYSPNTELVKSFIEYMYSDKGLDCYRRATKGSTLPFNLSEKGKYTEITLSDFQKAVSAIPKESVVTFASTAKMFTIGGVNFKLFNGVSGYINSFYDGSLTAQQLLQKNYEFMTQNWASISSKID